MQIGVAQPVEQNADICAVCTYVSETRSGEARVDPERKYRKLTDISRLQGLGRVLPVLKLPTLRLDSETFDRLFSHSGLSLPMTTARQTPETQQSWTV